MGFLLFSKDESVIKSSISVLDWWKFISILFKISWW
jgi:hypothetical protein